jgi:hypothetical protein
MKFTGTQFDKGLNLGLIRVLLITTISLSVFSACTTPFTQTDQPAFHPTVSETVGGTLPPMTNPDVILPDRSERRETLTLPGGLDDIGTPEPGGVIGEVPDKLLDEIVLHLAENLGVSNQAVQIIKAEAVIWSDGSLGCPKPGTVYTQVLVDGYHVILGVGEQDYDYRVSDSGYFFLCEGLTPPF